VYARAVTNIFICQELTKLQLAHTFTEAQIIWTKHGCRKHTAAIFPYYFIDKRFKRPSMVHAQN